MSERTSRFTLRKLLTQPRFLVVVCALLLSVGAFGVLSPTRAAHAEVGSCSWQGDALTAWGSSTGWYVSSLHVDVGNYNPYVDGISATGYYNNGKVSGNIFYQDSGGGGYLRFIGTWQRTQGNSGGPYQYGRFYLDIASGNSGCGILGRWTYGNIDPLLGQPGWIWQGSKSF